MKDNFQLLDDTRHMLQWLADEPYTEIRNNVESILREQMADSRLLDFAVTSPPDWLTVGTRSESNPEAVTINRTAWPLSFACTCPAAAAPTSSEACIAGRPGIWMAAAAKQTSKSGSI